MEEILISCVEFGPSRPLISIVSQDKWVYLGSYYFEEMLWFLSSFLTKAGMGERELCVCLLQGQRLGSFDSVVLRPLYMKRAFGVYTF